MPDDPIQAKAATVPEGDGEDRGADFDPIMSATPSRTEPSGSKATSPAASGPAGPLFEGQIGAHYLLSMLAGGEPRGLPGTTISRVEFQRSSDDRPLDDVIVHGTDGRGSQAVLEIQVKRSVTFTPSDTVFSQVVSQLAKAAARPDFDSTRYELAVAIERTSTKIERSYQEVLSWARHLESPETFAQHIARGGQSNDDMRKFVATFRKNLELAGAAHDDQAVWRILRRFQILVFDFNQRGSASELLARERAAMVLTPEDAARAADLWNTLAILAQESAANSGELTPASLHAILTTQRSYHLAGDRRLAAARDALQEASRGALKDISNLVGTVHIDRAEFVAQAHAAMDAGRYVEIRGDSGVGKSGVLKHLAEQISLEAQVIVLSPDRTIRGGWLYLRSALGCTVSARDFLSDLASDGGAVLFIDGVDIFDDDEKKATVRDLVRAAAEVPNFSVIVTARKSFDLDEPSWLPQEALDALGRAPKVLIDRLTADEIEQLRAANPSLVPLLEDDHPAREVIRNLFRLARLARQGSEIPVPLSEGDMAKQWWRTADGAEPGRRERSRLLRALAENMLKTAGPLDTSSEPPIAIQSLVESATLRELQADRVVFHHDILRDWAIGCLLHDDPARLADLPLGNPPPETLIRGVEIAARLAAERATDDAQWLALLERLSQPGVHGSWRRAVLLALVRSEVGASLLNRASKSLVANGGALLKELIRITVAVDSEPSVAAFAKFGVKLPPLLPDFIVPSALSWAKLIVWSLAPMRDIPNDVIPDLVNLYSRWSMAKFGHDPLTPYLLGHLHTWLTEMEAALHPDHFTGLRRPFGLAMSSERERDLEANLRMYFLAFCQRRPDLAEPYLRSTAQRRAQDSIAQEIMKFRGSAAQAAPAALANLTLRTLIPAPEDEERFGSSRYALNGPYGVYDNSFFPASPAQGPMLELLVHSPENGLRVVRQLVDVAINYYSGGREHGEDAIVIRFPGGNRTFPWIRSYNWSRGGSRSSIVTSALMALEAWGHMRIEVGEAVDVVLADILGPADAPAAFLLVAVDLLISHWPKSAKDAVPFLACPELLSLDRTRYAHDLTGLSGVAGEKEPNGLATLKTLRERPSRRVSLDEIIGNYTQGQPELLAALQRELAAASARVGPVENEASMKDVRFAAAHAVNLANPANWHEVTYPTTDGSMGTAFEYRPPAAEEALINAGQSELNAKQFDARIRIALTMAIDDRRRSSADLVAQGVAWARKDHPAQEKDEDDDTGDKGGDAQTRVIAAALAMRDGDDSVRAAHEAWARKIFAEALGAPDDPIGNHPLLPYNTVAIATVGLISLVRRKPDAAGIRSLLEIAARHDQAILPAFSAELSALSEIDERLPCALMRVGFSSLIQALHDYREPKEAMAARVETHHQRVIAAIERELAWLNGGQPEPAWPAFPVESPRPRYGRRLRPPTGEDHDAWQDQEERKRPLDIVNSQGGAMWIEKTLPLLQPASMHWFRALVDAYAEWTAVANGAGLADNDDPDRCPLEWNIAYFDLAARTLAGLSPDEIDRSALQRILALPDESFFDVMATLIRTLDELYFNHEQIDAAEALRLRSRLAQRLVQSRGWRRVTERKSSSIETHIGRAIASLFCHKEIWGGGKCYINPSGAERMNAFLPLLSDVAVDAAPSKYVATQFMDLIELRVNSGNLGYLVRSASAWLSNYPDDTAFWLDLGMGRRLCEWLAEAIRIDTGVFIAASAPTAELDHLLDALVRIGVAAARPVEESLARLRQSPPSQTTGK